MLNTTLEQRLTAIDGRLWRFRERIGKAHPHFEPSLRLNHRIDSKIDDVIDARLTPYGVHKRHCDTKYCSLCMGTEAEFNEHEREQNLLHIAPRLLADAVALLEEHVRILSGQQFERNPTALILNGSKQLLDRIKAEQGAVS